MSAPTRRAVLDNLINCYHNSFEGAKAGIYEHSPQFIKNVVEGAKGNADLAAATLRLDPRLTSTDQGAVAFSVAKVVSEDKQLSPVFIDLELVEETLVVHFDKKADRKKAETALGEVGRVGVIAEPGTRISDSVVSDIFMMVVEPATTVTESVVTEMKKKFPPKSKECSDKKGDEKKDEGETKPESAAYSAVEECMHYGLAEDVFGDALLASCQATNEGVAAAFRSVFGEKATQAVLAATIGESAAPGAENPAGQRNRLLRVLAGRGYLPHGADPIAWQPAVAESLAAAVSAQGEKLLAIEEAKRSDAYEAAVAEVAVALDAVLESADDVFTAFVDRIVDTGVEAVSEAKRDALLARIKEAAAKNERAVIARCVKSLAAAAMFERGVFASAEIATAVAAWKQYVAEATKAPAPEKTALDDIVADVLGLDA